VAYTICGNKLKYEPGPWFNSAKFFDIEYQTYGWVWNELKENEVQYYWEHPDGRKCLKLVYDKNDQSLLGVNAFGLRLRHEICDKWIRKKTTIQTVVEQLPDANFDPELYRKYEKVIQKDFH